ncbi:MAG: AAA family ATPase [Planctomycetaceae bacterium]|nr:AAA family ATPase [Planctomycetaceae bacterium]MCB9954137.1 AAA family ATPase [Planctomycetaceae bacterium]
MPPADPNTQHIDALKQALQQKVGSRRYSQWFGGNTQFLLADDQLVVEVASPFLLSWIEKKYRPTLVDLVQRIVGPEVRLSCRVGAGQVVVVQPPSDDVTDGEQPAARSVARTTQPATKHSPARTGRLATLSDFVIGPCNELAIAAAEQVVENPHEIPFVYFQSTVGNGKTHLLEGILRELRKSGNAKCPLLMGAEQFTNYFMQAMSSRTTPMFRARFQSVDVLLLDDVDFLNGKRSTQDEFLHLVKQIQSRGGQVIVGGNCHPRLLDKMPDELISRFQSGLVCRIESPDEETRRGIVARHAQRQRVSLSRNAVDFIVSRFTRNVRELEGTVNVLATWSRMTGKRVNGSITRELLGRMERDCLKIVRMSDVERAVCDMFGVTREGLCSDSRKKTVTQPRMLAMYLARRLTNVPYSEIGEYFGRRNHSTVISAERKIEKELKLGGSLNVGASQWAIEDVLRTLEERARAV